MKILHIVTSINLGGAENHLYSLVSKQISEEHQVMVIYLKGDAHWLKDYQKINCKIICLDIPRYIFLYRSFKLQKIIKAFIPEIIHAHMPPAELVVTINKIFSKNLRKIPLVVTKHNNEPFAPILGHQFLLKLTLAFADGMICISRAVQEYHHKSKLPKAIIYYGIDQAKIKETQVVDLEIPSDQFVVGTVARLVPQKSLSTLLNAFKLFSLKYLDSTLVIVGVGELERELKNLANSLGIESKIIWAQKRSDALGIMKRFNAFVLPSLYEGLGLVILEALALEVPIIASRVSAIPEVLDEGRFGILFEAKNYQELFLKLVEIKEREFKVDPKECSEMLERKFSLHSMYLKTQEFYCKLILSKRASVS